MSLANKGPAKSKPVLEMEILHILYIQVTLVWVVVLMPSFEPFYVSHMD